MKYDSFAVHAKEINPHLRIDSIFRSTCRLTINVYVRVICTFVFCIFRVLANYMMWHVVLRFSPYLSFKFREVFKEYQKTVSGTTAEDPRWQECLGVVSGSFGMPLGLLYVDETFEGESKKSVGKGDIGLYLDIRSLNNSNKQYTYSTIQVFTNGL